MTKTKKAEQSRERYYWYKARGICVRCGSADAEKGSVSCKPCRIKDTQGYHNNREQRLAKAREWRKAHPDYYRDYFRARKAKQAQETGGDVT